LTVLEARETAAERRGGWLPLAVLGALMALVAAVLLYEGRNLIIFFDEWSIVLDRRAWDLDAFLKPHNEHIALLPVAVFKLLFVTVGLDDYWVYRTVAVAVHLVCVGLLFMLLRRRLGDWPAVLGAGFILLLGSAWEDLLWPFQIGFVGSIAAGLGVLLALESQPRPRNVLAAVLLTVSLACSSIGLPFVAATFVDVIVRPGWRSRLWVPLTPFALWVLWYLAYGKDGVLQGTTLGTPALVKSNLPLAPEFAAEMVASGFGALVGLAIEWGRPVAVLAVVVLCLRLAQKAPIPAGLASVLALGVAYWGLTAVFRAHLHAQAAPKYMYLSAVIVVLVAAELLRGVPVTTQALVILGVVLALAAVGNLAKLQAGSAVLHDSANYVAPELAAVELAADYVDPAYRPDPGRAPAISAGRYLQSVEDLGSAADTPEEALKRPEPARQAADAVLVQAMRIGPYRARAQSGGNPPKILTAEGSVERQASCAVFHPSGAPSSVELETDSDLVATNEGTQAAEYRLRFFADGYSAGPSGTFDPAATHRLPLGRGNLPRPWRIRVTAHGPIRLCAAA
jgi:hypothetical protein